MGASKRDIHKKSREYEETYSYTDDGIAALLKDINRLDESRFYNGDIDATALITDLKLALDSECLTPRMRQVISLYYFVDLGEDEIGAVLQLDQSYINRTIHSSLSRISKEMDEGGSYKKGHADISYTDESPLYLWLNDVGIGGSPVYKVPEAVFTDVLNRSRNSDVKANQTLKQREYGAPIDLPSNSEDYVALTEDQFKWKDRRMSFKPEIYPKGDLTGTRAVAIKLRDGDSAGNEWVIEKRKMFAKRGN